MSEEQKITGSFGFIIKLIENPDGTETLETTSANKNVLNEIIIMQMKAYLKNLEGEYFANFNHKTFPFKS